MILLTFPFSTPQSGFLWTSTSFTGTSDWIVIPSSVTLVSIAAHPAAGQTMRVEYTLSSPSEINAGTAKWMPWPLGNVSTDIADSLLTMCIAVRGVSSGGTANIEVLAR